MLEKIKLMSIDPSINNLGMALWEVRSKKLLGRALVHPEKHMEKNEFDKSISMFHQIRHWGKQYVVTKIVMEIPETWAVAGFQARETGSMTKLMFVCGMLYSLCDEMEEFKLVTPAGWKGQLSKEVMCNRLREHYLEKEKIDLKKLDANVSDAIGIGHFYLYGRV